MRSWSVTRRRGVGAGSRVTTRCGRSVAPVARRPTASSKLLAHFDISRLYTSPYVRCVQTLEPLAAHFGLAIEPDEGLTEGADWANALKLVEQAKQPIVFCSHGDVIGDLMHHLAMRGVPLDDDRIEKGSTWVLRVEDGEVVKARYLPPPE